jgi:hypothetical protein
LVLYGFISQCQQHLRETCCLHLQGLSDNADIWRAYIWSIRDKEYGKKGLGQTGRLQACYREGSWVGSEMREESALFKAHQRVSCSLVQSLFTFPQIANETFPFSLLMLGWSAMSVASLMICYVHLAMLARTGRVASP